MGASGHLGVPWLAGIDRQTLPDGLGKPGGAHNR